MQPIVAIAGTYVRRPEEFSELPDQVKAQEIRKKVIDYFTTHKQVTEEMVHEELSKELGLPHEVTESLIYSILSDFMSKGKWNQDPNIPINQDQLMAGINVEMEHTSDPLIAERIARDHLAEIPDYYTRLAMMEAQGKHEV